MNTHEPKIKNRRVWVILLNVTIGVIALSDYAVHLQMQWDKQNDARRARQVAARFVGYKEAVRALQSGQLRPYEQGAIMLPEHLKWLTPLGYVYEVRHILVAPIYSPNNKVVYSRTYWLFPTSQTQHHARVYAGYIYSADARNAPPESVPLYNEAIGGSVIVRASLQPVDSLVCSPETVPPVALVSSLNKGDKVPLNERNRDESRTDDRRTDRRDFARSREG